MRNSVISTYPLTLFALGSGEWSAYNSAARKATRFTHYPVGGILGGPRAPFQYLNPRYPSHKPVDKYC